MKAKCASLTRFFCLIFLLTVVRSVHADENFKSSYDLTYKVNENGLTSVTENVHITNLTSEHFPKEYILKINNLHINNLRAFDKTGLLENESQTEGQFSRLHVKFKDEVVGLGHTLHWTLTYDTPDVAKKIGRIWEIFIPPKIGNSPDEDYTISLYVPESFGQAVFKKPVPSTPNLWTKASSKGGVSAAFMARKNTEPYQAYELKLLYHLSNQHLYSTVSEIALPPDTSYQKVFIRNLNPRPQNVEIDSDGNWLAKFKVPPLSKIDVTLDADVAVFSIQTLPKTGPLTGLTDPQPFWESSNSKIKKQAQKLGTPEGIYAYVAETLRYDKNRLAKSQNRAGALSALKKPDSAICLEFTDLFIALARGASIPTREIDGFAYTQNRDLKPLSLEKDILHAWPEFFDSSAPKSLAWRMVDPTWASTTGGTDYFHSLDLDHIAFAIHGKSSLLPQPAGTYRKLLSLDSKIKQSSKDVWVTPQDKNLNLKAEAKLNFAVALPQKLISGLPFSAVVTINNPDPIMSQRQKLQIDSSQILPNSFTLDLPEIPPLGKIERRINFRPTYWTNNSDDIITFALTSQEQKFRVSHVPIYSSTWGLLGGILGIIFIFIVASSSRRLLFQK